MIEKLYIHNAIYIHACSGINGYTTNKSVDREMGETEHILEQFIPSPVKPTVHSQLKLPFVLLQLALTLQGESSIHSSISVVKVYIHSKYN